jgi:GNAT superfamily N-acetyltransferase
VAPPEFIPADLRLHRAEFIELNIEYVSWVFAEIEKLFGVPADEVVGMPARDYVPTVIDKVAGDAPPKGIFYLVKHEGRLAGMGGLRALGDGVAEIKRVFIRPRFRGHHLGDLTVKRLLADAKSFGYTRACLDTGVFMTAAQRVYENNGFTDRLVYEGVEVPAVYHSRWRFMERAL